MLELTAVGGNRIAHVIAPPGLGKSVIIAALRQRRQERLYRPIFLSPTAASAKATLGFADQLSMALYEQNDEVRQFVDETLAERQAMSRKRQKVNEDMATKLYLVQQRMVERFQADGLLHIASTLVMLLDEATIASHEPVVLMASLVEERLLRSLALTHQPGRRIDVQVARAIAVTASQPGTVNNVLPLGLQLRDDNVAHRVVFNVILPFNRLAELEKLRARRYTPEDRNDDAVKRLKEFGFYGDAAEREQAINKAKEYYGVSLTPDDTRLFINIMPSRRLRATLGMKAFLRTAIDDNEVAEAVREHAFKPIRRIVYRGYRYTGYSLAEYNAKYLRALGLARAPVVSLDELEFIAGITEWGKDTQQALADAVRLNAIRRSAIKTPDGYDAVIELTPDLYRPVRLMVKYWPSGNIAKERAEQRFAQHADRRDDDIADRLATFAKSLKPARLDRHENQPAGFLPHRRPGEYP